MVEIIKKYFSQILILILFVVMTFYAITLGFLLMDSSLELNKIKNDFSSVNQISDGFLNGEQWSLQVEQILETEIDNFQLNSKNKKVLHKQVSKIINSLINQFEASVHQKQDKFKDKIRMSFIRTFVDFDKIRENVPKYASTVVKEIDNATRRKEVKSLVRNKIEEILIPDDSLSANRRIEVLQKYHFSSLNEFNRYVEYKVVKVEKQQREMGYKLIGIMIAILILWCFLIKFNLKHVFALAFLFSVIVSFVMLYIGVNLPMLEIDARIAEMDLKILSGHVVFYDQILFYQSKSIWSVAKLLITEGGFDSVFVGILIVLFSIGFPVAKLLSALIWLFRKKKKETGFVRYLAFNSGKWSMADVMVVAIFISYIGFQSILSDQLANISTSVQNYKMLNVLTTNKSNLQIGFLIFVCFVLFNLFLALILKRITKIEKLPNLKILLRDKLLRLKHQNKIPD